MKIGLLGGVFNPPHRGHLMIARQVLDFTGVQEVWFLPNYGQHPPKPYVVSVEHRLAMTRMLELSGAKTSTLEIDHQLDGNTITLLPYLPKEHEYVFIMGSDWLPGFHLWGHWEELLEKLPFLIFPRTNFPAEPLYKNMTVVKHELLVVTDISSTKIRERVKRGLSIDQFVPPQIVKYIDQHNLYK